MTELPSSIHGPLSATKRRGRHAVAVREVGRDPVDVEDRVHADDEHPVLPRQVAHRRDPAVARSERRGEPHVDALRVQVEPRQRHVVLPADQPADAPEGRFDNPQRGAVAHAPDGPLRTRRDELAVLVGDLAVRGQVQEACCRSCPRAVPSPGRRSRATRRALARWLRGDRSPARELTTAFSASSRNHSASPSQIGCVSIQIGVPGTNASGKTTSWAPVRGRCGGELGDAIDRRLAVHEDIGRLDSGDSNSLHGRTPLDGPDSTRVSRL